MEVHLTPGEEAKLAELASKKGCAANALAQEAIRDYLHQEALFEGAVLLGESELERGEFLTHEEVGIRVEKMLGS